MTWMTQPLITVVIWGLLNNYDFFQPLVVTGTSYELGDLDSDGVKWSKTWDHDHSMAIYLMSEPKSSWAHLKSFHPLISRLAWLWLSHPIFLTQMMWEVSYHQVSCVLSPVSRGSCSTWLGRDSPGALLSLFTFWNGNAASESQSRCFEMQSSRVCSNTDWKVYRRDRLEADAASPSGLLKALNIHGGFTHVPMSGGA